MALRREKIGLLALVAACLVSLAAAVPAGAAWQRAGVFADVSPTGFGMFDLKQIGGRTYIADARGNGLWVRRLSEDGTGWDTLPLVNRDPTHEARSPSLAEGPGGVPWIAWAEVDDGGARQIRVAHLSADGTQWVEPDGRDWEINYLPKGLPSDDRWVYGADAPQLAFLGNRPYVAYLQDNTSEFQIYVVRLAADGHSWERISPRPAESIPRDPRLAVIGGQLTVGAFEGYEGAEVDQLGSGGWRSPGDPFVNSSLDDPDNTGAFNAVAGFDGQPYALWTHSYTGTVYVAHVVDGKWALAGGPLGNGHGADLREIGGRLYAAWIDHAEPPELHVSVLADDRSHWTAVDDPVGYPVSSTASLAGVGGVPYVAWALNDGEQARLVVSALDDAPDPIGPDETGSGLGPDPNVTATPVLPGDDPQPPGPDPKPPAPGLCGPTLMGTAAGDHLVGTASGDTMRGLRGNDVIDARAGSDCLFGAAGDDSLNGGPGVDRLHGGPGDDVLRGGAQEDRLYGDSGSDRLYGGGDEDRLVGGRGNDLLKGGGGWDDFRAGPGNDTILAADGRAESVRCGRGVDTVRADPIDRLHGCEHVTLVR